MGEFIIETVGCGLTANIREMPLERPLEELKGFKRITLNAGETQTVSMKLPASTLAYWDVAKHNFIVEKEPVQVMVASSSADIRGQKSFEVR